MIRSDAAQTFHLCSKLDRISAIQPIGQDDDDCPSTDTSKSPAIVEVAQPLAEPGSTGEVRNGAHGLCQSRVGDSPRKLTSDPREASSQSEGLYTHLRDHSSMSETEETPAHRPPSNRSHRPGIPCAEGDRPDRAA